MSGLSIYVAASWRTERQPEVVRQLREAGYTVYDFRNPPVSSALTWTDITPWWAGLSPEELRQLLGHPVARGAFEVDMAALRSCDACVLVLPSGRSAHLEMGWAAGAGKRTAILLDAGSEAELMSLMAERLCGSIEELIEVLRGWAEAPGGLFERLEAWHADNASAWDQVEDVEAEIARMRAGEKDPDHGPRTRSGLRITDEVVEWLYDREVARLRAEAIREAAALADDERRAAIADHVRAGLEAMQWERRRG